MTIFVGVFVLSIGLYLMLDVYNNHQRDTYTKYCAGQIILPDYSHDDTLIVINPKGLEEELKNCSGSDYSIWYTLHKNCAVINQTIGDYQLNVNNYGYTVFDSQDTVSAEWDSNKFEEIVTNLNL